ncbi:EAL domain-containing protein [Williamsia muralis]|uniref:EAL domain-containing protein n=1 Tax=Williamsia marianensis TaxID=85044 RepID=UPI003F1850B3
MPRPPVVSGRSLDTDPDFRTAVDAIGMDRLGVVVISLDPTGLLAAAEGWELTERLRPAMGTALRELLSPRAAVFLGPYDHKLLVVFDASRDQPEQLVGELIERMSRPTRVDSADYFVQAKLGVATAQSAPTAGDPSRLVQSALAAVHCALVSDVAVSYSDARSIDRLRDEVSRTTELSSSVGSDFDLFYQPIVDIKSSAVVGHESLLRWRVGGEIRPPAAFLDAAEETSLIVPIGRLGVIAALHQLAKWQAAGDHRQFVSVNFSVRQLSDPGLVQLVRQGLEETGVPPSTLWIEVTERDLIRIGSPAEQALIKLDELGCTVCVDDLGTGFAALRYMVEQPVKVVKVDRSLISKVETDDTIRTIVRAVCSLSDSLGIATVAEGVEDEAQLPRLRELGFTHAQGYFYGRPVPAEDIAN